MADPFDPFVPTWLNPEQLGAAPGPLFGVEPPLTATVPGIGVPAPLLDPSFAAVPAPDPNEIQMPPQDARGSSVALGFPHDPGVAIENEAGPVVYPDGALPSPGPVLHPDVAPTFNEQDQAAITSPEQLAGAVAPTRPSEVAASSSPTAPVDPFASDPLSNPDQEAGQRQLAEMASKDPAKFIAYSNAWQQKRAQHFAQQELEAEQENQRRAEQNLRDRQDAEQATAKKMQQLDTDAQNLLVHGGIKNDRWFSSRTTGEKAWAFIGAIAGGMRAGMKGGDGRNHFLDGLQHTIDQDIASQQADLENARGVMNFRRGVLADEFARTGNLYQAAEATRLASYGSVLKELQAQQQLYDPRGTTAMSYAGQINDWQGRMAATSRALGEHQFDQEIKVREQLRKEAETTANARKALLEGDKIKAEIAKMGAGTGVASGKTDPYENQLLVAAGIPAKDRGRAIFAPDGKSFRLATTGASAETWQDEINTGSAAIAATDSSIAALLNEPDIMTKLKAKVGLNPRELAVLNSKLSMLKPQLAKLASGSKKIPVVEVQAVEAAIDDPSKFTAETLAQLQAIREDGVNELVKKFGTQFPNFLTRDSFGAPPRLADEPNAATVAAPLLSKPVKGEKGYQPLDAGNALGQLEQLLKEHAEKPTVQGPNTPGGMAQAQKDYQDQLNAVEKQMHDNVGEVGQEIATLSKKPKRTDLENERLANAKKSIKVYDLVLEEIPKYREKSVAKAQSDARDKAYEQTQQEAQDQYLNRPAVERAH